MPTPATTAASRRCRGITSAWTSSTLDGRVYGEPLILNGSAYVATQNNTLYGFDTSTGSATLSLSFGLRPVPLGAQATPNSGVRNATGVGDSCGNVDPLGVTGTPVIDPNRGASGTLFAVAETWDGTNGSSIQHVLVSVDLSSHAITTHNADPAIFATGSTRGLEQERGALALASGHVIVPYGGLAGDCGAYHGFVVSLPEDLSTISGSFEVNKPADTGDTGSRAGGIWGAGGAVVDGSGNVYVTTGNGFESSTSTYAYTDGVVKLDSSANLLDYFAPTVWRSDDQSDADLGSAAPLLIPRTGSPLVFATGKQHTGYLLDGASLGHIGGQQSLATACDNGSFGAHGYMPLSTTNATLAGYLFVPCREGIRGFKVNTAAAPPTFTRQWIGPADANGPPIIAGGLVWSHGNGRMYGLDPTTGSVVLTLSGVDTAYNFSSASASGGILFYAGNDKLQAFGVPLPPAGNYHPITPHRIADTRTAYRVGPWSTLGPAQQLTIQVAGTSQSGIPASGAGSVVVNVTAVNPSWWGFLTAYQTGGAGTSTVNFAQGQTVANLAVVPLGASGQINLYNSDGFTDAVLDVVGWTSTAAASNDGRIRPLTPARIDDTRSGMGQPHSGQTLGPYQSMDVQVTGAGSVPSSGVEGAVLNVTVTDTTGSGYLTVYPTGTARPNASNLNYLGGKTVANRVYSSLGTGGKVTIYNDSSATQLIVDVNGWFTDASTPGSGGSYTAREPTRIVDTRPAFTVGGYSTVGGGQTLTVPVAGHAGVPNMGAATPPTSVVLNLTATGPGAPGWLIAYAGTNALPPTSDLNFGAGQTIANLVVVKLGTDGTVKITNESPSGVDLIVDVQGWFS